MGKGDRTLPVEGDHKKAIEAFEAGKTSRRPPARRAGLPNAMKDLVPGTWVWIYNGNADGHHSMIFAGWVNPAEDSGKSARKAYVFDQGEAGIFGKEDQKGGRFRQSLLDESTLVYVARPAKNAAPTRDPEELLRFTADPSKLPESKRYRINNTLRQNINFLNNHRLDAEKVWRALTDEAEELLRRNSSRMLPSQLAAFGLLLKQDGVHTDRPPTVTELTRMVALVQRLRFGAADGNLSVDLLKTGWMGGPESRLKKGEGESWNQTEQLRIAAQNIGISLESLCQAVAEHLLTLDAQRRKTHLTEEQQVQLTQLAAGVHGLRDLSTLVGYWQRLHGFAVTGSTNDLRPLLPARMNGRR